MTIDDLLKTKTNYSELSNDWIDSANNALEVLNDGNLNDNDLKDIFQSSSSPNVFSNFIRLIYIESKKPNISIKSFDKIKKYSKGLSYDGRAKNYTIKEYSISSWLDSVNAVSNWLEENKLDADLSSIVDYIACSTETVNLASDNQELVDIVRDFLKDFGFERSLKADK